jgi:hypothetical protein
MNQSSIAKSLKGSKMTYKWNSIWYAELFTPDGRLQTKVKFRVHSGSTQADVLAKIEDFKAGRERTFKAHGICSMTKRKLKLI